MTYIQQVISILDKMIGESQDVIDNNKLTQVGLQYSERRIETLKEAKSRIQALGYGGTYQDPRPNDRGIEY